MCVARLVRWLLCQSRADDGAGSCGGDEQQLDSGYISKVEPMRFVERLVMGCEKERGSRVIPELLA